MNGRGGVWIACVVLGGLGFLVWRKLHEEPQAPPAAASSSGAAVAEPLAEDPAGTGATSRVAEPVTEERDTAGYSELPAAPVSDSSTFLASPKVERSGRSPVDLARFVRGGAGKKEKKKGAAPSGADAESLRQALRELAAEGSAESVGFLLEFLADSQLRFSGKERLLVQLLSRIDDPRIYPAARSQLESAESAGDPQRLRTLFPLFLASGGDDAADQLFRRIRQEASTVSAAAADAVDSLDPRYAADVMALLRENPPCAAAALRAMIHWKDGAGRAPALALARDASLRPELRETAVRGLALQAPAETVRDLLALYQPEASLLDRQLGVAALQSLTRNAAVLGPAREELALPFLERAFFDEDLSVRRDVVRLLPELGLPAAALLPLLDRALAREPDESAKRELAARIEVLR